MTPEGKIKDMVKKELEKLGCVNAAKAAGAEGHTGWFYMPVQTGMGVAGIPDFIGHYKGIFFAIETKTPKGKTTTMQKIQLEAIRRAGGLALIVREKADLDFLMSYVKKWGVILHD